MPSNAEPPREEVPVSPAASDVPKLSPGAAAIAHAHLPPPEVERYVAEQGTAPPAPETRPQEPSGASSPLVQILPWDFRTSFPAPLEAAIEAGRIHEDDAEPENLRSLHEEHAQHALVLLSDLEAVLDARRRGVDPQTGRPPRTSKQRERLDALFRNEPKRLEHEFDVLMDVYEEAFGAEAANAFRKAIRAWHAGIEVMAENAPLKAPQQRSVEAGVFGKEDGEVVNPTREEISEITEHLTDELIALPDGPERRALLSKYAEDFGEEAARELDRWARLKPEADEAKSFEYDPGHPWHYYHEGDGADPVPLESIPVRDTSLEHFGVKWPKNPAKRRALVEQMLAEQRTQLAEDEKRYQNLIDDGVDALSQYDREIAHGGNDDLAWASAVALKFTHISGGRGRVKCLDRELGLTCTG